MLEFRTMSLPSVMLFVSMKMSRENPPVHCAVFLADQGTAPSFVMLTGSFKGLLVKKACGLCSALTGLSSSKLGLALGTWSWGHFMVYNPLNPR